MVLVPPRATYQRPQQIPAFDVKFTERMVSVFFLEVAADEIHIDACRPLYV